MRVGDNLAAYGTAGYDLKAGTADTLLFVPDTAIRVVRWGVVVTTAAVGTDGVFDLDHTTHNEAGTAARANRQGGQYLTLPACLAGKVYYVTPDEDVVCKPGDMLHIDLITSIGTSGNGTFFLHYQKLNWDISGENAKLSDAGATVIRLIDGGTDA
jgi:hypothetical protein